MESKSFNSIAKLNISTYTYQAVKFISLIVSVSGVLVLLGWIFDTGDLKHPIPGTDITVANTALGFIFSGFGLWFSTGRTVFKNPKTGLIASVLCAASVSVLGLATLSEYLFGVDLGIDDLFVRAEPSLNRPFPDRMASMTALNFSLLGLVLIIHQWQPRFGHLISEAAAVVILGGSGLVLLGYLIDPGARALDPISFFSSMCVLSALLFTLLSLGVLLGCLKLNRKTLAYLLTIGGVSLAFTLHLKINHWFGPGLPSFVTFYSVIMLASLLAGIEFGLFALALSAFLVVIWIYEPVGFFSIASPIQQIALILFMVNGLIINFVVHHFQRHRQKALLLERNQMLSAHKQRLWAIFNRQNLYSVLLTLEGRILEISDSVVRDTGVDYTEVVGKLFLDGPWWRDLPETCAQWQRLFEEARARPGPAHGEAPFFWKDGSLRFALNSVTALQDEHGEVAYLLAEVLDITERKQAEEALQASEARYRHLVEIIPVAVYSCDATGVITFYNKYAEDLWGCQPRIGDPIQKFCGSYRLYHPDGTYLPHDQTPIVEALATGKSFSNYDVTIEQPDGSRLNVLVNIDSIRDDAGNIVGVINAFTDITERRQAEEALRRRAEEVERLLDVVPAGVWVAHDPDCRHITGNLQANEFFEANMGDNVSATTVPEIGRFFTPGGIELAPEELPMQVAVATNQAVRNVEIEVKMAAGRRFSILGNAVPLRDEQGRVRGGIGSFIDITERKRVEQNLKRSEQRYRRLHENMRDAFVQVDMDGCVLDCNELFCQLVGYTRLELETITYIDLTPSPWHAMEKAVVAEQVLPRGYSDVYEKEYRRKDGVIVPIELRTILVSDEEGRPESMWALIRDITARKQAELALLESQRQLVMALDAGQLGFWDWDVPSGRVQFGGQWAAMLGYKLSEIEPNVHSWEKRLHPDEKSVIMATLTEHLEGRTEFYECEHRMQHKDGTWRWILDRGRVVERDADGRPLRAIGTHADVTARREAENALQEADRQKNVFLAMLGHELRNPLTPINNIAQTLGTMPLNTTAIAKVSEMLTRNVNHITNLVDDLLDVSRITRGLVTLDRHPTELGKLLKDTVESVQSLFIAKQQTLNLHLPAQPIYLDADLVRLTQVFSNLLINASKYTGEGGCIDLSVNPEGQAVEVSVQDNGMGIQPELLPHIFDLFTQGERTLARSEGGLGVGLTLVKKLVDLHGGEITATSRGTNQGSEFVVKLPILIEASAGAEPVHTPEFNPETEHGLRILMIDDNEDVLDSISLWLEMQGHQVKTANNGMKGISIAQSFTPDIILLDIGLPEMDGYQVAKKLREQPNSQGTVIIIMSGYCQCRENPGKDAADFDHYLLKPPDLSELQRLIEKCQKS